MPHPENRRKYPSRSNNSATLANQADSPPNFVERDRQMRFDWRTNLDFLNWAMGRFAFGGLFFWV